MKRKQINKHAKLTVLTSLLLILTLLISGCSDPSAMAGESVTTATEATTEAEPTTTAEPSPINQVLSDEMTAKIDSAYMETYNKSLQFEQTEQHAVWYLGTYDNGIVFYKKFVPPTGMHISYVEELVVADKVFSLSSYDTLCVYKDGAVKQVYDAYEDGEMSEENVLLILEQYDKLMNRLLNWSDAVRPIE